MGAIKLDVRKEFVSAMRPGVMCVGARERSTRVPLVGDRASEPPIAPIFGCDASIGIAVLSHVLGTVQSASTNATYAPLAALSPTFRTAPILLLADAVSTVAPASRAIAAVESVD